MSKHNCFSGASSRIYDVGVSPEFRDSNSCFRPHGRSTPIHPTSPTILSSQVPAIDHRACLIKADRSLAAHSPKEMADSSDKTPNAPNAPQLPTGSLALSSAVGTCPTIPSMRCCRPDHHQNACSHRPVME